VAVIEGRSEDWQTPEGERFDLVFAATAWDWIDPRLRYVKAAQALRRGGHLAFWDAAHVFPTDGDPFFAELQDIYDEIGEGLLPDPTWPRPGELPDRTEEIEASKPFDVVDVRQFDWETTHDADSYVDLLNTFSGHLAMQEWQRQRPYGEIRRRLVARPAGLLRRHWGAALHIARRAG
jgi:SAM-dependent methyltransferase